MEIASSFCSSQQEGSNNESHFSSSRKTQGPMNRFLGNLDEYENVNFQIIIPPTLPK